MDRSNPDGIVPAVARAPLRIGLGGGGTDLAPYCDRFGGAVLNVTIDRFVEAHAVPSRDGQVHFVDRTIGASWSGSPDDALDRAPSQLALHAGVYRRFVRDIARAPRPAMAITTSSETPAGSGLGASSTLVVSMVAAMARSFGIAMSPKELAHAAVDIERHDVRLPGGRQDQYAAAFGGLNLFRFHAEEHVSIDAVKLRPDVLARLEASVLLFHTGMSRDSSAIIREQQRRLADVDDAAIEAMHALKRNAMDMHRSLLGGDFDGFFEAVNQSWVAKKVTAGPITNGSIDAVCAAGLAAGARAVKVSGAGGGGFVILFVEPARRADVTRALERFPGTASACRFTTEGCRTWSLPLEPVERETIFGA